MASCFLLILGEGGAGLKAAWYMFSTLLAGSTSSIVYTLASCFLLILGPLDPLASALPDVGLVLPTVSHLSDMMVLFTRITATSTEFFSLVNVCSIPTSHTACFLRSEFK